ncbi:tyrosine-type recombinase/integrase [Methanofollis ethanolicus]|uniref:tyrosine-type recombinase/integrase n=1 Tax=Methanofollis ethanolicus TaxID=488124 RepID=UPI001365E2CC|nr:tyrosine-type recombinase/integrase [Methanofollis ethanolicus]
MTKGDAALLSEFVAEEAATKNLSPQRRYKLAYTLCTASQFFPSVDDLSLTEVYDGFDAIRQARKPNGDPYKQNTVADLTKISKRFLIFLAANQHISVPAAKIEKIRTSNFDVQTKTAEDILTEEEVKAIIDATRSVRYRAMIAVMYEGGLRAIDVASLRWKDVSFFPWGARIRTDEKTGFERSIPIISYTQYLAEWKASYPGTPEGENFVFVNMRGLPMQYRGFSKAIGIFAKEAGIEKHITPHIFRHSRITHALRGGLQETIAKKTFWGNEGTEMIKTYAHLVDGDADRAFAALAGVEIEETRPSTALDPVQCDQCHTINVPGAQHCHRCGAGLTPEARRNAEGVLSELQALLSEDPAFAIEAIQRIREKHSTRV